MPFIFRRIEIEGLIVISPKVFSDSRGFFVKSYKATDFKQNGIVCEFVQDNHSKSSLGVLRGLHYQIHPYAQAKLIRVVKGRVWDVAVDIRRNSPTFLKWFGIELSGDNNSMLFIPAGFAHGFISLTHEVHLLYKCSREYNKDHERGIMWNDQDIDIKWPFEDPVLSEKDKSLPFVNNCEIFK